MEQFDLGLRPKGQPHTIAINPNILLCYECMWRVPIERKWEMIEAAIYGHPSKLVDHGHIKVYSRRRRPYVPGWPKLRVIIFARDNYHCVYCGSDKQLEADHVIPVSRGGENTLENLVTACKSCNTRKRDRTPAEWYKCRTV